jgi:hypothetical protein
MAPKSSECASRGCLRRVSVGDQRLLLRCENGKKWLRKRIFVAPWRRFQQPVGSSQTPSKRTGSGASAKRSSLRIRVTKCDLNIAAITLLTAVSQSPIVSRRFRSQSFPAVPFSISVGDSFRGWLRQVTQCSAGGEVAAHAVHAPAGRRRGRADV